MRETIAYECEHCDKIYKNQSSCRSHEYKCYFNPRTRSCASCAFNRMENQYIEKGVQYNYVACLANFRVAKNGLKTQCESYLSREHSDDSDIMGTVEGQYELEPQYQDALQILESARKGTQEAKSKHR